MKQFSKLENFPHELVGRMNSFIDNEFDDSLTTEKQMRAVIKWIKKNIELTNEMVEYLNEFIKTFDENLYQTTKDVLNEWLENGVFETVINETIFKDLNKKIDDMDVYFKKEVARLDNQKLNNDDKINVGNLGEDVLALMSGDKVPIIALNSIDSDHIKNKSIMANRLEYLPAKAKIVSQNIFNKNFIHKNSVLKSDGSIIANPYPELDLVVSDFIRVKPNTKYRANSQSNRQWAFYSATGTFIRFIENQFQIETKANEYYLRFSFEAKNLDVTMLSETHDLKLYDEYKIELEEDMIGEKSIADSKMVESYPKNDIIKPLFLKSDATENQYISYMTGKMEPSQSHYASDFIPIKYEMRYEKTGNDQFAFYDENKNFVRGMEKGLDFYNDDYRLKYIRLTVRKDEVDNFIFSEKALGFKDVKENIKPIFYGDESIADEKLIEPYLILNKTNNLFDVRNRTNGYYISFQNGVLNKSTKEFSVTDFLPVESETNYQITGVNQLAFFDEKYKYVSGATEGIIIKSPKLAKYVRLTYKESNVNNIMFAKTNVELPLENRKGVVTIDQLSNELKQMISTENKSFDLLVTKTIYLTVNEEFNLYTQNVITNGLNFNDYTFKVQEISGNTYKEIGTHLPYKWFYVPKEEETKRIRIEIRHSYTNVLVQTKEVTLISTKELTFDVYMITTGDSFTAGYGIPKYIEQFINSPKLRMLGLNGGDSTKHDAWSGYSYSWLHSSEFGYLRSDRPLNDKDNVWDVGWGENEVNGWKTGQTYSDLTAEQVLHGKTRNQFYNPSIKKFDFSYYMSRYNVNPNVNVFSCLMGINDCLLMDTDTLKDKLPTLKQQITDIYNSVLSYNNKIKIIPILITPLNDVDNDMFINSYGNTFNTAKRSKRNVEIFNKFMLDNFNTQEWIDKGVLLADVNANFDYRYGILKTSGDSDIKTVKFDPTIKESFSKDIHPSEIGAKYIADTMRNWIISK